MRAGTVMTTWPVTVTSRTPIAQALVLMRRLDVRHLPVVERGAFVGILSDRDLADADFRAARSDTDALGRELGTSILEIMQSDGVCVRPETELSDVIELLIEHKVGAIPVVHPDTKAVLGIISYLDVLRAVREVLESERIRRATRKT
jgi:acetoin utilization protein AcuB